MALFITHPAAVTGNDYTGLLSPLDYGASTGASGSDNALAFNDCIAAAAAAGKGILVPEGTFLTNKISYDPAVPIRGYSRKVSRLHSNSAEALLSYTGTVYKNILDIRDIELHGNGLGTRGLEIEATSDVTVRDVIIRNFTNYGVDFKGVLVGKFDSCVFLQNVRGINLENDPDSPLGVRCPSNHLFFNRCSFNKNTEWAVHTKDGGQVGFWGCNLEGNGTADNAATGAIKFMSSGNGQMLSQAIAMRDCWLERNLGTIIELLQADGIYTDKCKSVMDGVLMEYNGSDNNGTGVVNVIRVYAPTKTHELVLRNCTIRKNGTAPVLADNPNAKIYNDQSLVEYYSALNGATYTLI